MHWDDLRFVLALNRAGTLVRAGKLLHVNTSTVGRRIQAIEHSLDTRLFDRIGGGYKPTPAAQATMVPKPDSAPTKYKPGISRNGPISGQFSGVRL